MTDLLSRVAALALIALAGCTALPETSLEPWKAKSGPCPSGTGCPDCTSYAGCGYCGSTGACLPGSAQGSEDATCYGQPWLWTQEQCPPGPPPPPPPLADPCAPFSNDCGVCTSHTELNCGYCASTGACTTGSYASSMDGACVTPDWTWYGMYCEFVGPPTAPGGPPPPTGAGCGQAADCGSCTTFQGCGWCATSPTTGFCTEGSEASSTDGGCTGTPAWQFDVCL